MARRAALSFAPIIAIIAIVGVLVVAGMFVTYTDMRSPVSVITTTQTSQTSTFTPPSCSEPCALWTKPGGTNPESITISPADSYVAVGNGSGVYVFDDIGHSLWSAKLDHQINSISISSDGSYIAAGGLQTEGGCPPNLNMTGPYFCPAGTYANGEVYLFNRSGKLLWSVGVGADNPVWKVVLSADGSRIAVESEQSILYMSNVGTTIWSYPTGGNFGGMDMSANGNLVVASTDAVIALNGQGRVLWSHPIEGGGVSRDSVAISPNASVIWAGSAVSGYNGTLYLFSQQGSLIWQRQIYSPALSIQTGNNLTAFVSTNWGALLYGADGSLLRNVTSSAPTLTNGGCSPLTNFWYWGGNQSPVTFFDSQGDAVSSFTPGGFLVNAALSPDGHYAAVVGNQGSNFSLAFVFLGQSNQTCLHD